MTKLMFTPRQRRFLICIFSGFSSGMPLFFFLNLLPIWLRSSLDFYAYSDLYATFAAALPWFSSLGSDFVATLSTHFTLAGPFLVMPPIDIKTIGLFNLLQLPYTLKFLWAPFLDRYSPLKIGHRRSWMLLTQIGLLLVMAGYAWVNPSRQMTLVILLSLGLTLFSATQDIAIDAFRREILSDEELGLGNSLSVMGYRIALLIPGSLSLILSDYFSWTWVFLFTALFMLPGMIMVLLVREPNVPIAAAGSIKEMILAPLVEYWRRKGASAFLYVIAFLICYKLGECLTTALSSVFYYDIGFSRLDIGSIAKYAQLLASIGGGLLGGVIMLKIGINKGLWIFGVAQMIAIFGFIWLASFGKFDAVTYVERLYLALVIAGENLAMGMGTAAFVAFIARESNPVFAAAQLALFSTLVAIPRIFFNSAAGKLIEVLGYYHYFWLCLLLSIPGMLLLCKVAPWREKIPSPSGPTD